MDNYFDELMGFDQSSKNSPFQYTTYRTDEFRHSGSFRSFLHKQYALLNIRRMYGMSYTEWVTQPMMVIYQQMSDVPEIIDIQEKINANFNPEN